MQYRTGADTYSIAIFAEFTSVFNIIIDNDDDDDKECNKLKDRRRGLLCYSSVRGGRGGKNTHTLSENTRAHTHMQGRHHIALKLMTNTPLPPTALKRAD